MKGMAKRRRTLLKTLYKGSASGATSPLPRAGARVFAAHECGYDVMTVEDATIGLFTQMYKLTFKTIFPRLSRAVKTTDVRFA
jgi:hypothetical protein